MVTKNKQEDNGYLIDNALKRRSEIPLLYRQSIERIKKSSQGRMVKGQEKHEELVIDFLQQITVDRLSSLHKSNVFDFHFTGTKVYYDFTQIKEAISDNVELAPNKVLDRATALMETIVKYGVRPVENIFDFHPDVNPKIDNQTLIKFISILEEQTYDNIWSDIMKFPFDNQKHGIRRHLIIGKEASTGKTIILEAIKTLLEAAAIWKENRTSNSFDAANWNADVIDKFAVLIDDDDPQKPVTEDYIKNFLNPNMPLPLGRSGQRWSEVYNGSSIIATNTIPAFFRDKQNDKRIIFIKLDHNIEEDFDASELAELHNLKVEDIMGFVNEDETQLFDRKNDWKDVIEDETPQIHKFLAKQGYVSNSILNAQFGKMAVKAAIRRGPKFGLPKAETFTINGETIYGYRDADKIIDQPLPAEKITYVGFMNIMDNEGERQYDTIDGFFQDVFENGKIKKEEQLLFSPAIFHDTITKENVTGYTGVVLDIDEVKATTMDELEQKIKETGLSAIAWETANSKPGALRVRVWFYRVQDTIARYKLLVNILAEKIDEEVDHSGIPIEHRFYVGGTNIRLINISDEAKNLVVTGDNPRSQSGLLPAIKNAGDGQRESTTYWALSVVKEEAEEQNQEPDQDFMRMLINESGMRDSNKTKLLKQFNL